MFDRAGCFAMLAVVLLSAAADQAFGQALPPPPENKNLVIRPSAIPPAPDYSLKVFQNKDKVPKAKTRLYQRAQDILNQARLEAPEERLRFFRSVISPDSVPVRGWTGIIDSITPAEEGVVVKIYVYADQPMMIDTVHIIESYSIVDGEVFYLGAFVPPRQSRVQIGH